MSKDRSSRPELFCKKGVFKYFAKFARNCLCQVSFLIKLQAEVYSFIKKNTLAQVVSCEVCEIFKNTFLTEHLRCLFKNNNIFYCLKSPHGNIQLFRVYRIRGCEKSSKENNNFFISGDFNINCLNARSSGILW